jgi:D-serine deaminase-like pyridoxal phosphate-dependent protein
MTEAPQVGTPLADLDTPVLLIDADAFEKNLEATRVIVTNGGVSYRPYVKPHKTSILAQRQIRAGAVRVSCAKLGEAAATWRQLGTLQHGV